MLLSVTSALGMYPLPTRLMIWRERVGVEYAFADRRLQRACASEAKLRSEYGAERARKINQRLQQLRVAESLADLTTMPGRFHALGSDRAGCFSLDLDGPYRLIFEPGKGPEDGDDDLDLASVHSVVVLEVVDYH